MSQITVTYKNEKEDKVWSFDLSNNKKKLTKKQQKKFLDYSTDFVFCNDLPFIKRMLQKYLDNRK